MHFSDLIKQRGTTFSFEFFPPKDEASASELFAAIRELEALRPSFVSVTYGAGGTTRRITIDLVLRLKRETSLEILPHLTCVCHTEAEIYDILEEYANAGIGNILALGGDTPRSKPDHDRRIDAFRHARDLVSFVRAFKDRSGGRNIRDPRGYGIGVAGYPEGHPSTPNRLVELDHLKAKVDAGASFIITQLFFDNRDFYDFRERCKLAGITVPIIAGVMPITSAAGMKRMADLAAGARFPASLIRAIQRAGDDPAAVRRVGVHWATEQCRDLLDHEVSGIHFYTLNRSTATREIYANLGVKDSLALA
ncbi:MAG: methylenetetrahydrofolate reductase [NAD(P)H] [Phycisphaeraceae bacterium]|nr:methylenetetrahydrofolate reductase [NAD(P)H] [Phycisphaeraceae bacterium]